MTSYDILIGTEPNRLCVCSHCLMAIESREGYQDAEGFPVEDDITCDWCNEPICDDFYYEI